MKEFATKEELLKLKNKESVRILAIESSCDETSVSIVENGRFLISNIIATQIDIHKRFGGVVPEVASRNHITAIDNVTKECLQTGNMTFNDIDAIAVTYGAGLLGALLVGVNFAKGLAYMLNLPLIPVSHIKGHISANYINHTELTPPFCCLLVSGGHTAILNVKSYTKFEPIGTTVDDAAGEAFDKVARVLDLSYPGGPNIDNLAKQGNASIKFVTHNSLKNSYNFSFSGIKTAVVNYCHNEEQKGNELNKADIACSFQSAVAKELSEKTVKACKEYDLKKIVVAGGVGANSFLRETLSNACKKENIGLYFPDLKLCTDNAAMIGSAAYFEILENEINAPLSLTAKSVVPLE